MKRKLIITLLILLSCIDIALAKDSASVSVSCIVPPAPENIVLSEENTKETVSQTATQQKPNANNEEVNTLPIGTIQEEIQLAQGKNASVAIQTIYAR